MTARRWTALVVGAVALTAGGYTLVAVPSRLRPADEPAAGTRTDTIRRRDIGATVLATGVIRPEVGAEVRVGSRASGIVRRLHVTLGDRVTAGQLLAELDPTEFRARVAQAAARLATVRAELAFATAEYERAEQMIAGNIVTQAEFDQVRRTFDAAAAQVDEAGAALRSAEIELGYTRIRAPIGGVVASVSTQVGETVAASFAAPTFVTIIDLERLEVWAYVDETEIGRVALGQPGRFTVDTYPGIEFAGAVAAIQPKAEVIDNVVNYVTQLAITDRQGRTLRPEMTATVNITVEGRRGVVAIPNRAIRRDAEGSFTWLASGRGPVRRAIETGYRGDAYTEVVQGLAAGDIVILDPERP